MKSILSLIGLVGVLVTAGTVQADHDEYEYKWPWRPTTAGTITTYPYSGVHGCYPNGEWPFECVAAYDVVISDLAVINAVYGDVEGVELTDGDCGPDEGFGTFVQVSGVVYAHLASASVSEGAIAFQGDQLGVQGGSGNVLPCPGGDHLHWGQSIPGAGQIDGGSATSTNSLIGEFSASGATLRTYYKTHGAWNTIGWTHEHCPGTCTLNMTANKAWGRMQDFRHHPDGFGGEFNAIHVANWDQTQAHLVGSIFWAWWAAGGTDKLGILRPLGMALQERGSCPSGSTPLCISFQRFHLGYVWMDALTGRHGVFCPDVRPPTDGYFSLIDVSWVLGKSGSTSSPREDINGSGAVTLADASLMLAAQTDPCRPE